MRQGFVRLVLSSLWLMMAPSVTRGLIAQILAPAPGAKVWISEVLSIRIRVEGTVDASLAWSLTLRATSSDASMILAAGDAEVFDQEVATVILDSLTPGLQYELLLDVETMSEHRRAESAFSVSASAYTLIPLDEGNLSRLAAETFSSNASGQFVLYANRYAEPAEFVVYDARTGAEDSVLLSAGSNRGVELSGDGLRVFFVGRFPRNGGSVDFGLGHFDRTTRTFRMIPGDGRESYSLSMDGRRVAYQGLTPERELRFFFFDEEADETILLTDDPMAIIQSSSQSICPRIAGSVPLMTRDGRQVVLITSATLGIAPEDAAVGCRLFVYDVGTGTLSHRASLPRPTTFGKSYLSDDGRWVSMATIHPIVGAISRATPALVDLHTGEILDPLLNLGPFPSFDAAITGDAQGVVISTTADLDPNVGNADHNLELFYYDRARDTFTQISETIGGVGSRPNGCPPFRPAVSTDGGVVTFFFNRFSTETCQLDGSQRNERNGLIYRFVHAVRKRPGNRGPVFEQPADARVTAGDLLTLTFAAQDPDADPISYFAQVKDGNDVPLGSEITDHHDGTATFSWPTRPEHVGEHVLRVAAFDEGGGDVFHDLAISVVPNDGPIPTVTPTRTVAPGVSLTPQALACIGDCDRDRAVSVNELVTGVSIALDTASIERCPAAGCSPDQRVGVDCLVQAVNAALAGCSH